MFWSRVSFWFFLVFMIPFCVLLAYANFTIGRYGLLSVNVFTIVMSAFNVYNSHRTIQSWKELETDFRADQINRTINGGK